MRLGRSAAAVGTVMLVALIVFGPLAAQYGGPVLRPLSAWVVWALLMAATIVAAVARLRAERFLARLGVAVVVIASVFSLSVATVFLGGPAEESTQWEWEYVTDEGKRVVRAGSSLSKRGPTFHEIYSPFFRSGAVIPGVGDRAPCTWTVVKPAELAGPPEHCRVPGT